MGRIRPKTGQNAAPMATLSAATRSFCGRARHLDANRNNVVRLEDEAISVRGQMRHACVGIGVRHVAKFKAEHAWPDAREIDGTDDRPVVALRIDLDQVDIGETADAQGAFDGVTRHRLGDNVMVRDAMLAKMLPVERRGHRGVAPVTIKITRAFRFRYRRLKQRYLPLVAIRLLQSGKRS